MKRAYLLFFFLILFIVTGCRNGSSSHKPLPQQVPDTTGTASSTQLSDSAGSASSEQISDSAGPASSEQSTDSAGSAPLQQSADIAVSIAPQNIEYYTADEVTEFFFEVVLNSEYYSGSAFGNDVVRKWTEPIRYYLIGDYSSDDAKLIAEFYNSVSLLTDGFPGASEASNREEANLIIKFLPHSAFKEQMGQYIDHVDAYGCTVFWYETENCCISNEIIGYDTDMDEDVRNAVLIEELYNGLGIINDTVLRTDSIIYQNDFSQAALSAMDRCILKLLYLPDMLCGMSGDTCQDIIKLHYEDNRELCNKAYK